MTDAVKWALIIAAIVAAVAAIFALPIYDNIAPAISELSTAVSGFVSIIGSYVGGAKSLVLIFVPTQLQPIVSGLITFNLVGWIALFGVKLTLKIILTIFG